MFNKKSFLKYQKKNKFLYATRKDIWNAALCHLSADETNQLAEYLWIFTENDMSEHWEVNRYISDNGLWDNFTDIRSKNTHRNGHSTPGIAPKYFAIVCKVLEIDSGGGTALEEYERY